VTALPVRFPSNIPYPPEKTSPTFVPEGIYVNLVVDLSNPKKPVEALPAPVDHLNSTPLSFASSVNSDVPPAAEPITNIGSTKVDIVESTVIVEP